MALKKHEIKQALAKAAEELEAMAGKSDDEGFKVEIYEALKAKVIDLNKQLGRVEEAEQIARNLAQPVVGQSGIFPAAPFSAKLYGRIKNFRDLEIGGRKVSARDQAFAAGMWFRAAIFSKQDAIDWCRSNGIAVVKAQGEGVDQYGGYLVPEELMHAIVMLREEFGVFRSECQVVPMGSDTLNWPRRVGGLTASFTGENLAIAESQANWDDINLTAKKIGALARLSNEIAEDAVISVADWLVQEIAYAFALKEDGCGFNGDGTSNYGGIRGSTWLASTAAGKGGLNGGNYTASSATFTSMVIKDLTGTMGLLPQYASRNAKWYMSQQVFFSVAATILAGAGGNRLDVLTQAVDKRLLGYDVKIAQALPITTPGSGNVMFHFGDLSQAAMMGERRGVTIKRSDHRYFENDQIGILGTERFDINVHDIGVTPNQTTNVPGSPLVSCVSP